eukprot:m.36896 g.36896  ORF g.36896 m.36896 type:complete len:466 (-) comp11058_c0_seq1:75-1472(-)
MPGISPAPPTHADHGDQWQSSGLPNMAEGSGAPARAAAVAAAAAAVAAATADMDEATAAEYSQLASGRRKSIEFEDLQQQLMSLTKNAQEDGAQGSDEGFTRFAAPAALPEQSPGHVVQYAGLVLTPKFFEQAAQASRKTVRPPVLRDGHLGQHMKAASVAAKKSAMSASGWQSKLRSPLGTFLTGVHNKYPWVQLAGHKGNFVPGSQGTICKKSSEMEREALEALMTDVLKPMVPLYYKPIALNDDGDVYLEMQDLLGNFEDPCVMDIKMGVRTFLETEVSKKSRRKDLLAKMLAVDPEEPTEEEKLEGITKLRYMTFREQRSSTSTLGFRIEGIKLSESEPRTDFKTIQHDDEVGGVLHSFLPPRDHPLFDTIRRKLLARLSELRETLYQSQFFWSHELIGSSLLFIYDWTGKAGIWMIDFGKTSEVDKQVTHNSPWVLGNREDGYLIGLQNLVRLLSLPGDE